MSCEKRFVEQLRERGLRVTPQRELILATLHQREGLFTAEEIYQQVHNQDPDLKLSTVYRTLELLEELELVAVVSSTDERRHYKLLGLHGLHHHLHCIRCGSVTSIPYEIIQPLIEQLQHTYEFEAEIGALTFQGVCAACRK